MDRETLLSVALGLLSLGILVLGADILASSRRRTALAASSRDELQTILRAAPPMRAASPAGAPAADLPPAPDGFVFRRHVSRDFASMELSHKRFHPALKPDTPPPLEFSTIQSEIRAALNADAPIAPRRAPQAAQLIWAEPERLAVLTLSGAAPEAGIALLRRHGISTLIAARGHPFQQSTEGIEILSLPDGTDAVAPLAARLRAKLAAQERIAFHTETGLSGAAALLAARFSNRRAG